MIFAIKTYGYRCGCFDELAQVLILEKKKKKSKVKGEFLLKNIKRADKFVFLLLFILH